MMFTKIIYWDPGIFKVEKMSTWTYNVVDVALGHDKLSKYLYIYDFSKKFIILIKSNLMEISKLNKGLLKNLCHYECRRLLLIFDVFCNKDFKVPGNFGFALRNCVLIR